MTIMTDLGPMEDLAELADRREERYLIARGRARKELEGTKIQIQRGKYVVINTAVILYTEQITTKGNQEEIAFLKANGWWCAFTENKGGSQRKLFRKTYHIG